MRWLEVERRRGKAYGGAAIFPRAAEILFAAWVVVLAPTLSACSKTGQSGTGATTGASREAQSALLSLEERWEFEGSVGRRALRPDLEEYLIQYGGESSGARARIMLAQIALLERRFDKAEELLSPVLAGRQSSDRDEAHVILAALDKERGHFDQALERLEPLEGKLLTREARDQYSRVRTGAAIQARRWRLAAAAMIAWLVETEPETAHVRRWIESAVIQIPSRALSRLLADWQNVEPESEEYAAREWLHHALISRLTDEALSSQDPLLARDLLRLAPPWLRASEEGRELADLAAQAQKEARVSGRALGVVLGGGTDEQRRRSVRALSGLLRGLDLGRTSAKSDSVRFLTAEDRGSIASALDTLTGLGASILIAGVDEQGAQEALSFAEARHVPVVTWGEVSTAKALKYGFMFGVSKKREQDVMQGAFPEAANWRFIGAGEHPCSHPASETFPFAEWRSESVDAIGILGGSTCLRRFVRELSQFRWKPELVVGLQASHVFSRSAQTFAALSVASFPRQASSVAGGGLSQREKDAMAGNDALASPATDWFFTLGLDLAQLIQGALKTLPDSSVTKKDQVKIRHEQARSALLLARARLVSSKSRGFSSSHRIVRDIKVQKSGKPAGSNNRKLEP